MANSRKLANNMKGHNVQDILNFLEEGEKHIKYGEHKNVILILGVTGSGKSTFTQFMAGNNDNLISKETQENSGEYIIKDKGNEIDSSTISRTIFPKLVLDAKTNVAFYDCPGFDDNRSAAHDISSTYFIKKIIDSADSIKLVFTISYPSVRQGLDRQGFMLLSKNVVEMVKNIEKFKHSIAFVVTKVDNLLVKKGKNYVLVSDKTIIANIASFLNGVRNDLQSKSSLTNISNDQKLFYEKAKEFVNILIDKDGQAKANIGILRRPDESGALSSISLLQNGKKSLEKILHENIWFSPHDEGDFGYTISSESQNYVLDLVETVNENISLGVVNIGQEVRRYYDIQEGQSRDIQKAYDTFQSGYDYLSIIKTEITTCRNPRDLIKQIIKNINKMKVSISNENLLSIINYSEYLTFIESVSNQSTAFIRPLEWAQRLSGVVKYLNDSRNWYNFLLNLHATLSAYEVQRNIAHYAEASETLKYQMALNNNQIGKLKSLKHFLDLVLRNANSEREYNNIKTVELNRLKLKFLYDLLNGTLNYYNIDSSCIDGKLILKGRYVRLSDIESKNSCQARFIEMFALNKVFIDTNLNETGNQVQLSIVAPTWDIIGKRKIILDGAPGEAHERQKARTGKGPGLNGEDGKPGKPGDPAGNCIGIAQNVNNGEYLTISANGGIGGPGQDGGNGANGKDGNKPPVPLHGDAPPWEASSVVNFSSESYSEFDSTIQPSSGRYVVVGEICSNGGNGGDGGIGGKGSDAGKVIITTLNKDSNIVVETKVGSTGLNGTGGQRGHAGADTGRLQITHQFTSTAWLKTHAYFGNYEDTYKICNSGTAGRDGKNATGIQNPKKVVVINMPTIINDYKSYVRENLNDSLIATSLEKFYNQIVNDSSLEDSYDTLAFVNELRGLEEQFYKLRNVLPFLPMYKSLLGRIRKYAEKRNGKMEGYNKKVLSYLYTATLSKIYSITNNVGNRLVVDLKEYFKSVKTDINQFNEYTDEVSIDHYKNDYKKLIEDKISEAENFIDTKITGEIDILFYQIDDKIELLIDETIKMQNVTKEEKRKLIQQKRELENTLVMRRLLGIAKIASQLLGFVGPVGSAVGVAVGAGITVFESLAFNDASATSIEKLAALPVAVKRGVLTITDDLKLKQQIFNRQLNDVIAELDKDINEEPSENLKDLKRKISDTKKKMKEEMEKGAHHNPESFDVLYTKRKEIREMLEKERKLLVKQKPENDEKIQKQLTTLNRIVTIAETASDVYTKIKYHETKINIMADAINQANIKTEKLLQYEKDIYQLIIPTCRGIENSVKEVENNLKGKSHAALDVSEWQIQSTLKDVKLQMHKLTKEFDVEEDLVRCIEKIEEGMTAMVDVYNRIEDYRYKAEFTDYVANIVSKNARDISIDDKQLNDAIDNLKLIIQSNVVLEKYEIAMDAFKQHVYPFAHSFLAEFYLPSDLRSTNTNRLIRVAVRKMDHLNNKMAHMNAIINKKYDNLIHNNIKFNSENDDLTSPFYVWKYDTNKHAISKLLEGKEITIKSDITQSTHLDKNAIKFNVVGIHFKLENETIQRELDKQLQYFKVTMIHSGNSYYGCDNKLYLITSDNQTIHYSLGKDIIGDLIDTTQTYEKLRDNEPVLSPYTMWNIKLTHIESHGNFNRLAKYKNQVIDLELEGRGQYIDTGIDVCKNDLNKYYTLDDTISQIDNIDGSNKRNRDKISDVRSSIISSNVLEENHYRKRRDADAHARIQNHEESLFATSGASNIKPFSINNIFNLMDISLTMLKYLNPVNKIANWFIKDEINVDGKVLNVFGTNTPKHIELSNIEFLRTDLPKVSNTFADDDSGTTRTVLDNSFFCGHGNLLLLDLIIRYKSGVKYKQKGIGASICTDFEYAQTLAYRKHMPGNV